MSARYEDPNDGSWREILREYAVYGQAGMMFPVSIAVGFLAGYLVDRWLESWPWASLAGLGVGVAAAVMHLFRTVEVEDRRAEGRRMERLQRRRERRRGGGPGPPTDEGDEEDREAGR